MTGLLWPAAPVLSERLANAGGPAQRRIAEMLADRAIQLVPFRRADEVLLAIRDGAYGAGELRNWLRAQSDVVHSEALQADQRGDASAQEEWFTLARAIGTAYYALDADPNAAAQGAAYESLFLGTDGEAEALIAAALES